MFKAIAIILCVLLFFGLVFQVANHWRARARFFLLVSLCAYLCLTAPASFAAAATGSATKIVLSPETWGEINQLIVALVLALGGVLWKWLDNRSPLKGSQAEEITRGAYMDLLQNAAKFGLTQAQGVETKVGEIDVGNAAVAAGANFVIAHGPDLAAKMGFDIRTPEGQAAIIRSVTLRVGDLVTAPGAPPAALPLPKSLVMTQPVSRLITDSQQAAFKPAGA